MVASSNRHPNGVCVADEVETCCVVVVVDIYREGYVRRLDIR